MDVLVDTSVWSLAYRRSAPPPDPHAAELAHLIREGRAFIIGPVRHDVLSGIRVAAQFNLLRNALRAFPDLLINTLDCETAVAFRSRVHRIPSSVAIRCMVLVKGKALVHFLQHRLRS